MEKETSGGEVLVQAAQGIGDPAEQVESDLDDEINCILKAHEDNVLSSRRSAGSAWSTI